MSKISVQKLKLNLESSPGPDAVTCHLYDTFTHEFCSVLAEVSNHFFSEWKTPKQFFSKYQTSAEI